MTSARTGLFGACLVLVAAACGTAAPSGPPGSAASLPAVPPPTQPLPTPDTGLRVFTAPGIAFSYPSAWQSLPFPIASHDTWALRYLASLRTGRPACGDIPTPWPADIAIECQDDGLLAGSLSVVVSEHLHTVPGEELYGRPTSFEPDTRSEASPGRWHITDPSGGIYSMSFMAPHDELHDRQPEIEAVLDSVVLSEWQRPATEVVDGWANVERRGVSIEYPTGWAAYAYMPGEDDGLAGAGGPTELIASEPVEPCIPVDQCHLLRPPARAVVLQLRWSASAFWDPKWERANDEVGGHPAIRHRPVVLDGIERQDWDIRRYATGNEAVHVLVALAEGADESLLRLADDVIHRLRFSERDAAP